MIAKTAFQIQVYDSVPFRLRHFHRDILTGQRPGVIDKDINLPEFGDDSGYHIAHLFAVGHVTLRRQSLDAFLADVRPLVQSTVSA